MEIYDIDTNKYKDDDEFHYDPDVFNYLIEAFDNPEKLFKEQNINKYNYFNFEIYHEYYHVCGSFHCNFKFTYKYLFSKTKSNKYLFKTIKTYGCDYEGSLIEYIEKEERYCEKIDYNNYYFINKDIKLGGDNYFLPEINDYENINSFNVVEKKSCYDDPKNHGKRFLEIIHMVINIIYIF